MSTQEERLKAIADAIREKDGTTEPISAHDFPERIRAIKTGSGFVVPLVVAASMGTVVTAVNGEAAVTGTVDESGTVTLTLPAPGDWSVTAQLEDKVLGPIVISVPDGYSAQFSMLSRLPDGYTEVEYIESDGTAVIETGVIPTTAIKLAIDLEPLAVNTSTTNQRMVYSGVYHPVTGKGYYLGAYWTNAGVKVVGGTGSTLNYMLVTLSSDKTPRRMVIEIDYPAKKAAIVGEAEIALSSTACAANMSPIQLLHDLGSAAEMNTRLYSCQIELDGARVRDLVPCCNAAGTAGVYDLVSDAFYPSAGTGAFIPGPTI